MKRRIISFLMAMLLVNSISATALAASTNEKQTADALYTLGLFLGTGNNSDGTPNYELDNTLTRAHAIILLVRMLGKEDEALKGTYTHPFKDTAPWYDKYVGYAYTKKLTNGTGDTTYSGNEQTTAQMFATFCLRSLGYDDSKDDFTWDKASEKAKELGIGVDLTGSYSRGEAVETFWDVLNTKMKGSDKTLAEKLESDGVFTKASFDKAKQIEQGKAQIQTSTSSSSGSSYSGGSSGNGSSSIFDESNLMEEDNTTESNASSNSTSNDETNTSLQENENQENSESDNQEKNYTLPSRPG